MTACISCRPERQGVMELAMTTCPACKSKAVRVGWPEGRNLVAFREPGCPISFAPNAELLVPLTCKKCGHKWSVPYLPPKTEGERRDQEKATA